MRARWSWRCASGEAPLYLVHFSQDAALATAQALSSYGVATKEQRETGEGRGQGHALHHGVRQDRSSACWRSGVGVHHAGMLPRYRLLVEKLAQQGLLPVICGTDTLGVGINVPIHTVVLTALTKFDGHNMRRLRAREFHQIVGRAGRSGFDTEGLVIAEAPEHDIENAKARGQGGRRPEEAAQDQEEAAARGLRHAGTSRRFEQPHRRRARDAQAAPVASRTPWCWPRWCRAATPTRACAKLIADSAQTDEEKAALRGARSTRYSTR